MKLINVVGARPNFMKIAPIIEALERRGSSGPRRGIKSILVHTGQHYDERMSRLFFRELGLPRPDIDLEVGSGTHAEQTGEIMKRFEPVLMRETPDAVLIVGDVNSTIACALTAAKLGIKVIHVEAGLRSFDRTMPEEINRLLTDAISDILFTTERSAARNLTREGIPAEKIFFVGNVMIDTLLKNIKKAGKSDILERTGILGPSSGQASTSGIEEKIPPYGVLTLHRPSNVDDRSTLAGLLSTLEEAAKGFPIIFPARPRTMERIEEFGQRGSLKKGAVTGPGIYVTEPLGYLDFLHLMTKARVVLTDSGGIQEETTIMGIPCITIRDNTERPVTITEGTNRLAGTDRKKILQAVSDAIGGRFPEGRTPELWDGKAAERVCRVIEENFIAAP